MTILAGAQMLPMLLTNTSNTLGPTYWLSIFNPMLGCSHPKHYHQLPGTTTPKTVFKCTQHAGPSGEGICAFYIGLNKQTNKIHIKIIRVCGLHVPWPDFPGLCWTDKNSIQNNDIFKIFCLQSKNSKLCSVDPLVCKVQNEPILILPQRKFIALSNLDLKTPNAKCNTGASKYLTGY